MLIFGHLALGYLVGVLILNIFHPAFTPLQMDWFLVFSTLIAILPDLDVIYFYSKFGSLRYQKNTSHRNWISHAPVIYIITGLLIYFLFSKPFINLLGFSLILGSLSHFLADSLEYGVMWFWPFSKKKYAIRNAPEDNFLFYRRESTARNYYWNLLSKVYSRGITIYLEIFVIILALVVAFT